MSQSKVDQGARFSFFGQVAEMELGGSLEIVL
jgi:hypothetical protein